MNGERAPKKKKTSHFVQTQFHRQCIHMLHTILVKLSSRDQKGGVFKAAMNANTVDGLEIRRSPVEVGSLSHYLQGFIHPRWLFGIPSINSSFWPLQLIHSWSSHSPQGGLEGFTTSLSRAQNALDIFGYGCQR